MTRRVVHLDAEPGYRGGQRQLLLLAAGQLGDPDLDVLVLCRSARLLGQLEAAGVRARAWRGPSSGIGLGQARAATRRADVLHAHDARSHGLARLLTRAPARLVVHRRIDDVPHSRRLTRWKYAAGDLVCVSEAVREGLAAWGVPPDRLHTVPSAAEAPASLPARPPPRGPFHLLSLGALVQHKGHADLLDALAILPGPVRLEIAGDGPERGPLEAQAHRLGLGERLRFLGDVAEGRDAFARADLFVQPSRSEGLGTAVLDAFAAGLPVVASRVGGLPELVQPGRTGWLAAPRNPASLAAAITDALALATQHPEQFSSRARTGLELVQRRHGVGQMLAGVRAVYDRPR